MTSDAQDEQAATQICDRHFLLIPEAILSLLGEGQGEQGENNEAVPCDSKSPLEFYKGTQKIEIHPFSASHTCCAPVEFSVIDLHRVLMLPAHSSQFILATPAQPKLNAEEEKAGLDLCSALTESGHEEGQQWSAASITRVLASLLEQRCSLLHRNWEKLVPLLLPSIYECQNPSLFLHNDGTVPATRPPSSPLSFSVADFKEWTRDGALRDRMHYSYCIVLQFYGWRMHCEQSGELDRHLNWRSRYERIATLGEEDNRSASSSRPDISRCGLKCYAELTRVIRVLVEWQLDRFAQNLVKYVLQEFVNGRLLQLRPMWLRYWLPMAYAMALDPAAQSKKTKDSAEDGKGEEEEEEMCDKRKKRQQQRFDMWKEKQRLLSRFDKLDQETDSD